MIKEVYMAEIKDAQEFLKSRGIDGVDVMLTLGTGLGGYADRLENTIKIPYGEIPGFAKSTAPEHKGELIFCERFGKKVAVMSGRWHRYEGYDLWQIVFPTRVMASLGAKRTIITNASGAINLDFGVGRLMLIADHINMLGENPLTGPNLDEFGPRFPDMTDVYTKSLREKLKANAKEEGVDLAEGVYAMMGGPSLETPAEIRFLKSIGADAVGMSTVPEAIAAHHAGLEVIGISCLANPAAGLAEGPISTDEISEIANRAAHDLEITADLAIRI